MSVENKAKWNTCIVICTCLIAYKINKCHEEKENKEKSK